MGEIDIKDIAEPKVSVIIPVYNTEKYVAEAIASIQQQTLSAIEIIIINDGSTDASLEIINEIAKNDLRIRVFTKANEGPSEARNMGLRKANGKYIYFMDSDDLLEPDTLEVCYNRCEKDTLDFVFFDAAAFKEDTQESLNDYYLRSEYLDTNEVYSGCDVLERLMAHDMYRPSVWLCFVRKELFDKSELTFYPGIIHEDELFAAIFHINADRVAYIPHPYFKRRIRKNSITSSKFVLWNIECYLVVIRELVKYRDSLTDNRRRLVVEELCSYILNPAIYRAAKFSLFDRFKVYNLCRKNKFLKYISVKNKTILFFPFTITLKSFFHSNKA